MKVKAMQEALDLNKQRVALKRFIDGVAPDSSFEIREHVYLATKDLLAAAKMQLGRVEQSMRELGADLTA